MSLQGWWCLLYWLWPITNVNEEARCYQFCVAVCISRRGACHNSVKLMTVCQYAGTLTGQILTTSRWTHWEKYFPSLTLCLSFVPLSVIAGNLLRSADSKSKYCYFFAKLKQWCFCDYPRLGIAFYCHNPPYTPPLCSWTFFQWSEWSFHTVCIFYHSFILIYNG